MPDPYYVKLASRLFDMRGKPLNDVRAHWFLAEALIFTSSTNIILDQHKDVRETANWFELRKLFTAREIVALRSQVTWAVDLCPGDTQACHVGDAEGHWRCGTSQCGREKVATRRRRRLRHSP